MEKIDEYREIVKSFSKILGRTTLYGISHPASANAISSFYESMASALAKEAVLTFSSDAGKVIVNGDVAEEGGPLSEFFQKHNLLSLQFDRGVSREEVLTLLSALCGSGKSHGEDISLPGVKNIKTNTVHYVKAGERIKADLDEPLGQIESLEGFSFDQLLKKVIDRAVKKDEDKKKVYELVMKKFSSEVDDKIHEATRELENERDAILEEKKETENVVASSVLGTITVDGAARVVLIDPEAEKVVGSSLREKAGKPVWEGLGEGQMVTVARKGAQAFTVSDILVKGEDETKRTLRASNAMIKDVDGKMVGLFSVLSDMTRYRELEQMKKDFVANVTHELRTPLAATKQALSNLMLFTSGLGDDQKKMLDIALRNTERLGRLVNDILDFSKLEAGRIRLRQEMIEAGPLLKDILMSLKPLADSRGLSLALEAPAALPRVFVDRDRITQVLVNLLSNAIKFTPPGGRVSVHVSGVARSGVNTLLEVAVKDTGRGIDKSDIGKIFEKFVQVGETNNAVIKGTGLGLTITKAIVELHGGSIRVESEPGKGSVFTVGLPMLPEDAVFIKEGRQRPQVPEGGLMKDEGAAH